MEHWQFLIQQQGDRSWHVLESPNLEILAGQYRVLARSSLRNTDVEVRVTHFSTHESTPRLRIFKRSRRTNSEGLMAVIPFTDWEPGVWEVRCSGDLMSDILGKSWQYSVKVQVLSEDGVGRVEEAGGVGGVEEERSEGDVVSVSLQPDISSSPLAVSYAPYPIPATSDYVETVDQAIAIPTEQPITTDSHPDTAIVLDETKEQEDIAIDQPVSPVWLKGETTEQILQSLIELALPGSETLSEEEKVTDSLGKKAPPPLLLTLDRDSYIATWGQALTINGQVELSEKTNPELAEILSPKSLCELALEIELRSPLESQILAQVREPLLDQELPFIINTSIDIPAHCESKLILADISLYGRFTESTEIIELASQSFTITADVTELLAITAAAKSSTSSNDPIAASASSADFKEPEPTVKLDLKLFNLVKVLKTDQSALVNPSPNTPLPPQINLQVLRESILRTSQLKNSANSPQLPKLPPLQIDPNTPTEVLAESPTENEPLEKDITIAAINLEQLVIRQRRIPILDTTFPYLRRLETLPGDTKEDNAPDTLEIQAAEDLPQLDTILTEDKNTDEVAAEANPEFLEESVVEVAAEVNPEFLEESVVEVTAETNPEFLEESVVEVTAETNPEFLEEEVAAEENPKFIQTNLYSSPLLRKWMQSQGYSLPEPINELQSPEDDNYLPDQQTPLSVSPETPNSDVDVMDVNLLLSLDTNMETVEDPDTLEKAELVTKEEMAVERVSEEPTFSPPISQIPPPPPPINLNMASAWLAQEIVVDDAYSELEADTTNSYTFEEEEQTLSDLYHSLPINPVTIEPLPIPELHVPEGELIAGKSVIVRVVVPEVPGKLAIKLWVGDYQTRWLLDGPHLLTNLLPNALGGLEVMTQLNIPFGCLEIRLEAIALDPTTQQESHKVTVVRTVIPPDLPSLELDELLGM
jgi:hypothetical protein